MSVPAALPVDQSPKRDSVQAVYWHGDRPIREDTKTFAAADVGVADDLAIVFGALVPSAVMRSGTLGLYSVAAAETGGWGGGNRRATGRRPSSS
jgi:hypothetical protein